MIISVEVAQRIRAELPKLKWLRDRLVEAAEAGQAVIALQRARELSRMLDAHVGLVDAVLDAVEEEPSSDAAPGRGDSAGRRAQKQ